MSETPALDLKVIHRLLREIEAVARHASMAHMRHAGTPVLVDTYNRCHAAIVDQGDPHVALLFQTFQRDAAIDEVGAASALLASYVETKLPNPRGGRRHHGHPHMGHMGHPPDLFDLDDDGEPEGQDGK